MLDVFTSRAAAVVAAAAVSEFTAVSSEPSPDKIFQKRRGIAKRSPPPSPPRSAQLAPHPFSSQNNSAAAVATPSKPLEVEETKNNTKRMRVLLLLLQFFALPVVIALAVGCAANVSFRAHSAGVTVAPSFSSGRGGFSGGGSSFIGSLKVSSSEGVNDSFSGDHDDPTRPYVCRCVNQQNRGGVKV
jgi:hypothetical protein